MSFDLSVFSSELVKSPAFYAPQGLKRDPFVRGTLSVNYGEYPQGLTRKVGGILVIISFSPLIFPVLFCCMWRIKWEI